MTDTAPELATNRGLAHYPEPVATTDEDNLTPAQKRAVDAVRAACDEVAKQKEAWRAATIDRVRAVQDHARVLDDMGWRPAARAIGNITESTLRNDATRKLEEEN